MVPGSMGGRTRPHACLHTQSAHAPREAGGINPSALVVSLWLGLSLPTAQILLESGLVD
jgi:hypothetical protein